MELEELKDIWQKNRSGFQPKDEAELASMLRGSSKSIVGKLKRSVWFELAFTFISGLALLTYALTLPSGALKWTSVSILVLFVAYSFYYIKKLLLLNAFNKGDDHLKANLERLTNSLTSYLSFYKRSYTVLYPVYFCLGLLFVGLESGSDHFFEIISKPKRILSLVAMAALLFFLSTWFTNWYLKSLYGNHLLKLKSLLNELNSN
ncbi:hypothetical protein [Chryseosolibacter indicus]|uniref:DUF2157 domain-containing protein n=1 Tax=Chryseosolibacter indicus TaxID=2782351 RepID=A0ABS5VYI2_9BACT|nr:hypothetical protein [Chryseosolibacter indicus]MBT1705907.1 hypothetical protein [Chryseosolibacter indicus]